MGNNLSSVRNIPFFPAGDKFLACPNITVDTIADVNNVVNCVVNGTLKGQSADSASPTDVYLFDFMNNIKYNGLNLEINKGFMKVFVDYKLEQNIRAIGLPQYTRKNYNLGESIIGVKYEVAVYKYITSNLLLNNICPNFIKFYGSTFSVPATNLAQFIKDKIYTNVSLDEVKDQLYRNLEIMSDQNRYGGLTRPAIQDNNFTLFRRDRSSINMPKEGNKLDRYYCGFILNEAVEVNGDLNRERNVDQSMSVTNYLRSNINNKLNTRQGLLELFNIIFQICYACYAMNVAGLVHNDLHTGNIWVTKKDTTNLKYYLSDSDIDYKFDEANFNVNIYSIQTNNFVKIYDFDTGYIEGFNNPRVNDVIQKNDLKDPQRDFIRMWGFLKYNIMREMNGRYSDPAGNDRKIFLYDLIDELENKFFQTPRTDRNRVRLQNRLNSRDPNFNRQLVNSASDDITTEEYKTLKSLTDILVVINTEINNIKQPITNTDRLDGTFAILDVNVPDNRKIFSYINPKIFTINKARLGITNREEAVSIRQIDNKKLYLFLRQIYKLTGKAELNNNIQTLLDNRGVTPNNNVVDRIQFVLDAGQTIQNERNSLLNEKIQVVSELQNVGVPIMSNIKDSVKLLIDKAVEFKNENDRLKDEINKEYIDEDLMQVSI
jgi:hypothetical protein